MTPVTWAASTTSFSLDGDVVVRLLAAAVLGSLIGIEREAADQPAGLRTHIAVALGASLFGVISTLGFLEFDQLRANSTVQVDVSRVASNVVVGIGFLGAGVIFRQGGLIRNLTTAASLWTVAAIGLACGVGDVTTAAVATVVLLVSLVLLRPLRSLIRQRWATASTRVRVTLADGVDPMAFGDRLPPGEGVDTGQVTMQKQEGRLIVISTVSGHPVALRRWMAQLVVSDAVVSVDEE
jgi:putative Mg2+ transporter-C (MgtC) family protein